MLFAELCAKRDDILALAKQYGARRIRVFGSVARGEESKRSDIDFLVDFPRDYDLLRQRCGLTVKLEELLGKKVDLVPEHELNKHIRDEILGSAKELCYAEHSQILRQPKMSRAQRRKERNWIMYAEHVLQNAAQIHRLQEHGDIWQNKERRSALLYDLQTLTESASKLPITQKKVYPDISWHDIRKLRNTVAHDYLDGTDIDKITAFLDHQLEALEQAVCAMMLAAGVDYTELVEHSTTNMRWIAHAKTILKCADTIINLQKHGDIMQHEVLYNSILCALDTLSRSVTRLPKAHKIIYTDVAWDKLQKLYDILQEDHNQAAHMISDILQSCLLPLVEAVEDMLKAVG